MGKGKDKKRTACAVCNKATRSAHNVSHSHRVSKRRQKPNLQVRKIDGRKVRVCAKCIKRLKKGEEQQLSKP